MNTYYLDITCSQAPGVEVPDFEAVVDAVVEGMESVTGVEDIDLAADLVRQRVEFNVIVRADRESDALDVALTAARTALHCAEQSTAGWESLHYEAVSQVIRRESEVLAPV